MVAVSGMNTTQRRNAMAREAVQRSMILLLTLPPMVPPTRRPMSMQNQYAPIIVPVRAGPTQSRPEKYTLAVLGMPTSMPT